MEEKSAPAAAIRLGFVVFRSLPSMQMPDVYKRAQSMGRGVGGHRGAGAANILLELKYASLFPRGDSVSQG